MNPMRGKQAMAGNRRGASLPGQPAQRRGSGVPTLQFRLEWLEPRDVYALREIVRCGRLYQFGAAYALDRPSELGIYHMVSAGAVLRLALFDLVEITCRAIVPDSTRFCQATKFGEGVAFRFGLPLAQVGREWNEMPYGSLAAKAPPARRRANAEQRDA